MDLNFEQAGAGSGRRLGTFVLALLVAGAALCSGSAWAAQTEPGKPSTQQAQDRKQVVATHARRHRSRRKAQKPPSPSDETANPPQVTLDQGKLLVDAHNSDLSAILQDVAAQTGMTVDGLSRNTRVFGVYGPGTPRDVLSQLLTGAGYNFVMVGGGNENVPRELVLTAQNGNALPPNAGRGAALPPPPQTEENPDADDNNGEPLGPGAIAHPSPQDQDTDESNSDERMQQRLKNLQRMQQMIQENPQNQQNQPNQPNQQNQPTPQTPPNPPQ